MPKGYPDSPETQQAKIQKAIEVSERKLKALQVREAFIKNPPKSKVCSSCHIQKDISHFKKYAKYTDGFSCWCRECHNLKKRIWHEENKTSENAKSKEYSKKHAVEIRANRLRREAENPGVENERTKKYQREHAEKLRLKRLSPEWRIKARERNRKWCAANKEKSQEKCRREQAIRWHGAKTNKVSYDEIYKRDGGICYLCLQPVERKTAHFDHVIPLSKGGTHTFDNIKTTHGSCNLRKGQNLVTAGAYANQHLI